MGRHLLLLGFSVLLLFPQRSSAQLDQTFSSIFTEILDVRLRRSGSPGQHGTHFLESAARANNELVPALNSLIVQNLSSFPLSATGAGVVFDFSTGEPIRIAQSPGPIFAETGKTLGRGHFLIQANATYLEFTRFRGMPINQMQFTFTHQDVSSNGGLGDNPNESDLIDLLLDLHASAGLGVVSATYGVTNSLDVSVALPLVSVKLNGTAQATVDSYTFGHLGHANHFFGGDTLNPVLTTQIPYSKSATGIGDIALRLKYSFTRGSDVDAAVLADIRFATGKSSDFLGSGKTAIRIWGIVSDRMGDITPHLNLGYVSRSSSTLSDALEYRIGFDSKFLPSTALAMDLLGQFDINTAKAIHLAPGSVTLSDLVTGGQVSRTAALSNIPDSNNDNTVSLSVGLRVSASEAVNFFGNVLVPLNDGGLRARIAPTLGVTISL